ncbi:MAG: ABC transporter substrate-binidng protein [Proteobacteria bacterium]|nr:MAG: ABC transporter substrate-binidng protein [Pseudomonadota bacterium]
MVCLAFAWLWYETHKAYDVQGVNGQGFDVQIAKGDPTLRIAENLWYVGVIDSPLLFRFVARVTGSGPKMRAGWYHFEGKMSLWQVMDKVRRGDVKQFYLTVPEGLKTFDVLSLLAQETKTNINDWQAALKRFLPDQETEGRLLPETYQYIHPIDPRRILRTMINTQDKLLFQLAETPEERARLRIIASVIEKETSQDDERPLVSAAIYNRLRLKMPLQMDPTVIYGIWKRDGVFSGNIHRKDLKTDTPWNTYTRRGLPPTPICNPGAASLRAAAKPADVSYVYFVADGTGGHAFASTLAEHQANVRKWVRLERKSNIKKHVEKNFK